MFELFRQVVFLLRLRHMILTLRFGVSVLKSRFEDVSPVSPDGISERSYIWCFLETNIAPEIGPSQKEKFIFQTSMFRSYVSFREGICISMVEYVQYIYIRYICGNWHEYSRFVFAQISERILVSKLYRRNMTQAFRILQFVSETHLLPGKVWDASWWHK